MYEQTMNNDVTLSGSEKPLLAGRYRIRRQLGAGGMGSVWLAEDRQLDDKLFAVKMLPSILVANKRAYRQLKDEALVAMKLVHPNIVQIRAFEENNGNPFLVMDYIEGATLDNCLEEWGKLNPEQVKTFLKPIAVALDYAHGMGLVHRDVKPGNVMVREDGEPFILDFGIACEIRETMTRVTGKFSSGTLLYMSPEQLNGNTPTPSQDIYSFAAMAYECIKGEPPFVRGAIEDQIKNKMPEPLLGNEPTAVGIMAGLSKRPDERPTTCLAVLEGNFVNPKLQHKATAVEPKITEKIIDGDSETTHVRSRVRGNIRNIIIVAASILCAFAFGLLIARQRNDTRQRNDEVGKEQQIAKSNEGSNGSIKKSTEKFNATKENNVGPTIEDLTVVEDDPRPNNEVSVEPKSANHYDRVLSGTQKDLSLELKPDCVCRIKNRYIVPNGASFVIREGAKLFFDVGAGLVVQGKLVVSGSRTKPVYFLCETKGRETWDGIKVFNHNGSTVDWARISGAKVGVELSTAGIHLFNTIFSENGKALHTAGHYNEASTIENCLIYNNNIGVTFHYAALNIKKCSVIKNDGIGIGGSYYGNIKLEDCIVAGNGKGVQDGGYDGTAFARRCAIFGNKEFDVNCRSSKVGDFKENWWGKKTTQILLKEGDGVKLPNVSGNFVDIADFLREMPKECGSTLGRSTKKEDDTKAKGRTS